jgi:energy-coupling factor transport system permease protein
MKERSSKCPKVKSLNYQDKGTVIHRMNPMAKVAWGVGILVMSLIFNHPLYILLLLAAVLTLVLVARVWREWSSAMRLALWLGISIIVINALVSYHGNHVLLEAPFTLPVIGNPKITVEAIAFGTIMALRLIVIISTFVLINLTVHPDEIMAILLKLKFPYKSVLITSLATRFMPCLIEDVVRIGDAYRARGLELDTGNWLARIKNRAQLILPLLANSLEKAVQVAEAMEARAFGTGRKRTLYHDIKLSPMDTVTLGFAVMPLFLGILMRTWGYGAYQYYPTMQSINLGYQECVLLATLAIVLVTTAFLGFLKRVVELD